MSVSQYGDAQLSADPDDDMRASSPAGSGMRFWAALAVAGVAVAGFAGVVGYGYLAYSDRDVQGPLPLVRADARPDKVKPQDPGGLNVPHREVRVFDLGQPRNGGEAPPAQAPQVKGMERLLPPPEPVLPKPMPQPVVVQAPPVTAPAPVALAPIATPATAPEPITPSAAPAPVLITTPGPMPPPARPGSAAARALAAVPAAPIATAPIGSAPTANAPRPVVTPSPVINASVSTSAPSGYRVQIAALRSDEEARQAWTRLQRKHADILGAHAATISRVEIPERGTFYRVQAGPWRDRNAAEEACAKLKRVGTGCMIVPAS